MTICGLSLHHWNTESRKNPFFNWVHSLHTESMNASHSTNLFTNFHQWQRSSTLSYKPQQPTITLFALTKGSRSKRQLSESFAVAIQHLSTRLIKPYFCFDLPHRRSTTVSLETRNPILCSITLFSSLLFK